jgi:hypothetical protein
VIVDIGLLSTEFSIRGSPESTKPKGILEQNLTVWSSIDNIFKDTSSISLEEDWK